MSASTAQSLNGHPERLSIVKDGPAIDRTKAEHAILRERVATRQEFLSLIGANS